MHTTRKNICFVLLSVIIAATLACACAFILTMQNTSYATDDVISNLQETHSHEEMTVLSAYPTDDVTLCLNGHNVQGDGTDAVITASEGAAFTLRDSSHVETRPIVKLAASEQPPMQQPEQPSEADWIWIVLLMVLALIVLCEVLFMVYIISLKKNADNKNKGASKK